jgi:hypothetical protein
MICFEGARLYVPLEGKKIYAIDGTAEAMPLQTKITGQNH